LVLGRSVVALGGGRTRLGQAIDARVGFVLGVAPGDDVDATTVLAKVHAADEAGAREGRRAVLAAVRVTASGGEAELRPLISHRVDRDGAVEVVGRLVSEG
jgi:thymidine phosphorylase